MTINAMTLRAENALAEGRNSIKVLSINPKGGKLAVGELRVSHNGAGAVYDFRPNRAGAALGLPSARGLSVRQTLEKALAMRKV